MSSPQSEDETQMEAREEGTPNDEILETEEQEVAELGEEVQVTRTKKGIQFKKRERKEPKELVSDPGKSLFPISRVQNIIKADKEIPIVAKEAVFLISLATEEFIKRLCESSHQIAYKERRTTVQHKDIAAVVRKDEEFLFLEEIMPWILTEKRPKAKTRAGEPQANGLDHFVVDKSRKPDVIMNEDGTMYAVGNVEDDELQ